MIKNKTLGYTHSGDVGFDDDDLDFGDNLGKFRMNVTHLKAPLEEKRRFQAWMTDQDKTWRKNKDKVPKEHLLEEKLKTALV